VLAGIKSETTRRQIDRAADAIETLITDGLDKAQSTFNS
jgi:hypothetical protein